MQAFRPWVIAAGLAVGGVALPPVATHAAPAAAPTPDIKAQAAALYKEGAGLFREGKFKEAGDRFQAAYNLDPSPILLYNLARAAEEIGEAAIAVGHYQAYLARYPQAEDRAEVERRIRVLEAVRKTEKPGTLSLTGVPAGATVTLNGGPLPAAGADGLLTLAPGTYALKVTPPPDAGAPSEQQVEVRSGAASVADFGAGAPASGGERPLRLWGWVGVGVGVVVAGIGTYFYLDSFTAADEFKAAGEKVDALDRSSPTYAEDLEKYDGQSQDALDRMDSDLLLGRVLLSVGGVAAATGLTLVILDATGQGEGQTAFVPFPGGAGFTTTF